MLHAAHILCLVSPTSAALRQAAYLAQRLDATVHAVPHPSFGPEETTLSDDAGDLRDGGDAVATIPTCRPEPVPDSPSAILEYVADADIDLMVTDTPPDRGPVPPLATEVTQRLVEQLDRPLFVVEQVTRPAELHDILVPVDFSDRALQAFRHAVALARQYDATLHALHVVDSLPYVALTPTDRLSLGSTPLSEHRGRRRLQSFLRERDAADVGGRAHLAYGDVADEVVRFVGRKNIDLLVLASHGGDSGVHEGLGDGTERVLGRATCPVFFCRVLGMSLLAPASDPGTSSIS